MQKGEILKKEEGLTIVRLKGNPYEIGYQHGKLFKKEISWFCDNAQKILSQQEGKIAGKITFPVIRQITKKLVNFFPAEFQQELKGIADGSGVDYYFILLENLIEELSAIYHWYLRPLFPSFLKCSCFVVKDKERIICGRNLDYQFFTESLPSLSVLYVYLPDQGFPFISLGWPGNIGAFTGISRYLNLALLSSPSKRRVWKGISDEVLTRQIIQQNKNLDDAVKQINPNLVPLGRNLVLISKDDAKVVELSYSKKAVRHFHSEGYLVVTNHFQTKEMESEQAVSFPKPRKTILPEEFFTVEGSKKREKRLRELCLSQDVDAKKAMEILDKVSTAGTVQSIVSIPEKEEFWVAKNAQLPVTKGEWIKFKLNDLFSV